MLWRNDAESGVVVVRKGGGDQWTKGELIDADSEDSYLFHLRMNKSV